MDAEDAAYIKGRKSAYLTLMMECIKELGQAGGSNSWIVERAETIAALKDICGEYGDLEWDENLYIPDILRKHLEPHL